MTTARITTAMKALIIQRLTSARFKSEIDRLARQFRELGQRSYDKFYTEAERTAMEALPKGWLVETGDISFAYAGKVHRFSFAQNKRLLGKHSSSSRHSVLGVFDARDTLTDEYRRLTGREEELESLQARARAEIAGVINSCTTIGKLQEIWPEVVPHTQDMHTQPARSGVPAVQISALNELLHLSPANGK